MRSRPPLIDAAASVTTLSAEPEVGSDAWYLNVLQELADIGTSLARSLVAQSARQAQAGDPTGQLAELYARSVAMVTRSVRETVALRTKLEGEQKRQELRESQEQRRVARMPDRHRLARHRAQVRAMVEQAIASDSSRHNAARLLLLLDERLDDEKIIAALARRPVGEIALYICHDLGIGAGQRH